MRPSDVTKALQYLVAAKQPVMLHGQPGAGKSQVVKQVADALGGGNLSTSGPTGKLHLLLPFYNMSHTAPLDPAHPNLAGSPRC